MLDITHSEAATSPRAETTTRGQATVGDQLLSANGSRGVGVACAGSRGGGVADAVSRGRGVVGAWSRGEGVAGAGSRGGGVVGAWSRGGGVAGAGSRGGGVAGAGSKGGGVARGRGRSGMGEGDVSSTPLPPALGVPIVTHSKGKREGVLLELSVTI